MRIPSKGPVPQLISRQPRNSFHIVRPNTMVGGQSTTVTLKIIGQRCELSFLDRKYRSSSNAVVSNGAILIHNLMLEGQWVGSLEIEGYSPADRRDVTTVLAQLERGTQGWYLDIRLRGEIKQEFGSSIILTQPVTSLLETGS